MIKVFRIFLDDPPAPQYGYELMQLTGFPSGKLYPLLARLQAAGWLVREKEDVDPARVGRPRRYLFKITASGIELARAELAVLNDPIRSHRAPLS